MSTTAKKHKRGKWGGGDLEVQTKLSFVMSFFALPNNYLVLEYVYRKATRTTRVNGHHHLDNERVDDGKLPPPPGRRTEGLETQIMGLDSPVWYSFILVKLLITMCTGAINANTHHHHKTRMNGGLKLRVFSSFLLLKKIKMLTKMGNGKGKRWIDVSRVFEWL